MILSLVFVESVRMSFIISVQRIREIDFLHKMSIIEFFKASVLAECKYVNIKGGLNKHAGKMKDKNVSM